MRIFVNQQNLIETEPVIDEVTGDVQTDLDITFKLYTKPDDVLVTSSTVVLSHIANGVYRGTQSVLSLVDQTIYNAELTVKSGSLVLWYFKGPIKAIIRSKIDV